MRKMAVTGQSAERGAGLTDADLLMASAVHDIKS